LHEVGTRIAVAQATKKKKVQLQIAESLARRRTRKIGHERLVREAPAEVWNYGVLKKVANTNWTLSFAFRFDWSFCCSLCFLRSPVVGRTVVMHSAIK